MLGAVTSDIGFCTSALILIVISAFADNGFVALSFTSTTSTIVLFSETEIAVFA